MKTKFLSRQYVRNTENGNSVWDVLTEAGMFRTAPDAHVGLECQNWREGDEIEVEFKSFTMTKGEKL